MNKKYDRTDQERDQAGRLEQGEAEREKAQQGDMPRHGGQDQAGDEPRRQQGGWSSGEENRTGRGGAPRDGDSGEKLVDEP